MNLARLYKQSLVAVSCATCSANAPDGLERTVGSAHRTLVEPSQICLANWVSVVALEDFVPHVIKTVGLSAGSGSKELPSSINRGA